MNALEIHNLIHERVKTGQDVKAPEIQKINHLSGSSDLIPDSRPSNGNQYQPSFPWKNLILVCGVIILVISLVSKIPKSENYQSFFERVRKKSSE